MHEIIITLCPITSHYLTRADCPHQGLRCTDKYCGDPCCWKSYLPPTASSSRCPAVSPDPSPEPCPLCHMTERKKERHTSA